MPRARKQACWALFSPRHVSTTKTHATLARQPRNRPAPPSGGSWRRRSGTGPARGHLQRVGSGLGDGADVPSGSVLERVLEVLEAPPGLRARLLAQAHPAYARFTLADTPLGPPVDVGRVPARHAPATGLHPGRGGASGGDEPGDLRRWESGDSAASARPSTVRSLPSGGAQEALAVMAIAWQDAPASDPRDLERRLEIAETAPLALRDVLLLAIESEVWCQATRDPSVERTLCQVVARRAQHRLMAGSLDGLDALARRAARLARAVATRNWPPRRSSPRAGRGSGSRTGRSAPPARWGAGAKGPGARASAGGSAPRKVWRPSARATPDEGIALIEEAERRVATSPGPPTGSS